MYQRLKPTKGTFGINNSKQGETIEAKMRRIVEQNIPPEEGAPLIFSERDGGVAPEFDIRTDRWELAVNAMDLTAAQIIAKRDGAPTTGEEGTKDKNSEEPGTNGGANSDKS